ncbi:MAG: methionyl-tRNA formyltransferase [Myxococcota bacterium]|jgi:methionyl-tRNA formyltransferase|nr:methionyl-tRNA formyltransferase [Myxococcota bacterium]
MTEGAQLPRVVFLGTPQFACNILEAAARVAQVVLVITQKDKPKGRGREMASPPVKEAAARLGIPVIQPEVVKGRKFAAKIAEHRPDFLVTAAFGRVLGRSLLAVPARDALNVHASILPRHRGAAPANWAILEGDERAGVSVMRMVEALDAGPVFSIAELAVRQEETAGELLERLAVAGAEALAEVLSMYERFTPHPQDESAVTWARSLCKEDGLVDWHRSAPEVHRHIRGLHPWPGAYALWRGEQLKLHAARVLRADSPDAMPGTVISASGEGIDVACGTGILRLLELQAPSRKRMSSAAFLAGAKFSDGEVLGGR